MPRKTERRPTAEDLAAGALASLETRGTRARRDVASWYCPTRMRPLGVAAPGYREVARDLRRRLREAPPADVLSAARALLATGAMEAAHIGYGLLGSREDALRLLGAREVEALARPLDNWATVDTFCACVSGPAWRLGLLSDGFLRRWSRSKDRWRRRAALVSTVALNQRAWGGTGDTPRTLALCEALVDDRDDMVVKALSWALRALAVRDPAAARSFLARHGDRVAGRVRREVTSKLDTGRKHPSRPP